jgi:ribosomal protein S12 methylthiotransferase
MKQFAVNGYRVVHNPDKIRGEIVVVNTCSFINDAKEESVNLILQLAGIRKQEKIRKLFVMGCLSERYAQELREEIPEVDRFYGKFDWKLLISDLGKSYMEDFSSERMITTPKHYAYLKIAEGCNRTCSYCSIPLITGKYKSKTIETICAEVKSLVKQGVKEFQLIAQDLTYYGYDLYKKYHLPTLVQLLSDIPGVEWIRLHYAYPTHFPVELLPVIRERENVCNYLDIALQHSSDHILKLMRRNSDKQTTIDLINEIRSEVPGIHLRTTMMVGHPGETEDDFHDLLDFIQQMRFERLGCFMYSNEEKTYAYKHYKDNVSPETKQYRSDELMAVQREIAFEINKQKIGKTLKVIIDREEPEYYVGRTEYDSPEVDPEVFVKKTKKLIPGRFYPIQITGTQSYDLTAN